jgi:hypothetical protein
MAKRRRRRASTRRKAHRAYRKRNPLGGEAILWALGLTALGGAAVAAAVVAANSSQPTANPNPCPALPTGQTVTNQQYTANYAQTGTTQALQVGDTITVTLLRGGNTAWQFGAGDDTILSMGTPTTQADATYPSATDDVCVFTAVGQGSTTISATGGGTGTSSTTPAGATQGRGTGQNGGNQQGRGNSETASGSGTFNLTCNVNCPGQQSVGGFNQNQQNAVGQTA